MTKLLYMYKDFFQLAVNKFAQFNQQCIHVSLMAYLCMLYEIIIKIILNMLSVSNYV